jgi:energy-coupling factor transport system permease protein
LPTIVFGQFVPGDSLLHRLDARTKLLGLVLYAAALWVGPGVLAVAVCTLWSAWTLLLVRPPLRALWRGLAPLQGAIVLTLLAGWAGAALRGRLGGAAAGGVSPSVLLPAVRLFLLAWQSTLTTLTTDVHDLVAALGRVLRPAGRLGLPVAELALMATVTVRFVPMLWDEAQRIRRAQVARGLDGGGVRGRGRALVAMWTPLLLGAFRRSEELATALAVRGWSADASALADARRLGATDAWVLGAEVVVAALVVGLRLLR